MNLTSIYECTLQHIYSRTRLVRAPREKIITSYPSVRPIRVYST